MSDLEAFGDRLRRGAAALDNLGRKVPPRALDSEDWMALAELAETVRLGRGVVDGLSTVIEENAALRLRASRSDARIASLSTQYGEAREIIKSLDGIVKSPQARVQSNFEEFLPANLRALHRQIMDAA